MSLTSERIEAFYIEKENDGMDIKACKSHKKCCCTDNKMKIVGGNYAEYKTQKDYFLIQGKKLNFNFRSLQILKSNNKMEYWRSKNIAIATGNATAINSGTKNSIY